MSVVVQTGGGVASRTYDYVFDVNKPFENYTARDVRWWLKHNGLSDFESHLSGYTGRDLIDEYKKEFSDMLTMPPFNIPSRLKLLKNRLGVDLVRRIDLARQAAEASEAARLEAEASEIGRIRGEIEEKEHEVLKLKEELERLISNYHLPLPEHWAPEEDDTFIPEDTEDLPQ